MAKVAIVDDSPDTLELFAFVLRGHHEFIEFSDPEKFLNEFRPGKFALILLDIAMPAIDGFQVFSRIHAVDKNVPVVAITAVASPQEREKALKAGFCDYFIKPIMEIEKFRQAVYSHVGKCSNPPLRPPDESAA